MKHELSKIVEDVYLDINGAYNTLDKYKKDFPFKGNILALLNTIKDMLCEAYQLELGEMENDNRRG